MRTIKMLVPALALAGFAAVSLSAQQPAQAPAPQSTQAQPAPGSGQQAPAPQPQPGSQGSTQAVPVQSTANAPEADNPQLRPVMGELEKKLDSKNAKPGDPVVVTTTEQATTANGVVIPKGSRIVGHVTDVQPRSKTNENARLTLQFDQAQLKDGQTLPIKTVLESVAPAEVTVHPTDTLNAQPQQPTGGPAGSTGGNNGGTTGSRAGAAPSSGASTAPQTAGGELPTSPDTQQQAANAAPKAGTVVARQGNVAIKTTAIPGVLLAANADGKPFSNASGALLGAKRNVHLDGGTAVVLAVADAGPMPRTR